jgi:SAM-dependent methyltransferase
MTGLSRTCPSCRQPVKNKPFYRCEGVPVNSVILCQTAQQAATLNREDVSLLHCPACGFIYNATYDPRTCVYNQKYEETQAHSSVFNTFNLELASHLLNSYQIRDKTILEIGCGKGDFLNLLCSMGNNIGIGYDPAYVAERSQTAAHENVTIYNHFFPENYEGPQPDCIICKMTLEHIPDVHGFLGQVRKSIAPGRKPIVFFQVPDTRPILEKSRFWDIYYEHCSYFTRESLDRLFQQSGFQVVAISGGYDRQYLMIEAFPAINQSTELVETDSIHDIAHLVESFAAKVIQDIRAWQNVMQTWFKKNKNVVLWGGGSKAVAFLTTLKLSSEVNSVVDINPHKQGLYLPGTGHPVVAPEDLVHTKPDLILAMNPVYMEEIGHHLNVLDLECELLPMSNETKNRIGQG